MGGAGEAAKHTQKEIVFTIKILSRQGKMYDILFRRIYRGIRVLKVSDKYSLLLFCTLLKIESYRSCSI